MKQVYSIILRKQKKISVMLVLVLILAILPVNIVKKTEVKAAGSEYGLNNPVTDNEGVTTWDCVWFGNYPQSDATGMTKDPIKWRVLSVDGDNAFLLADTNLDVQRYNDTYTSVTWETCTMRTWLNSTFLNKAFNATEQAAIQNTTVVNEDNPEYGTEGGNNTTDKVYLLSISEVLNPSYGFNSTTNDTATREAVNTAYVAAGGEIKSSNMSSAGRTDYWWLRSPGVFSNSASVVYDIGYVNQSGSNVYNGANAVRPALHLNLSSTSSWSYAGTVTSDGAGIGTETPAPQPTVTLRPNEGGTEDQTLSLFDNVSGKVKSDGISKYLISDWSFKSPTFPVTIKKDYERDGSYKIKATIGIGKKDVLDKESSWNQYKSQVEKFKKNKSRTSELERLIQAYGGKSGTFSVTDKIKAKPSLGFMGYYELKYDKNDKLISQEGGGAATASWSGKKSWQSVVMAGPVPIPLYFDLTGKLDLEAELGIRFSSPNKKEWTGSLKLKPSLALGGGLGVSGVATVGVEGKGGFEFQAIPWSKLDYSASISLKAYIAFILDWTWQLPGAELHGNVWDTTSGMGRKAVLDSYGSFAGGGLSLADRSYAGKTTEWNGETGQAKDGQKQGLRSRTKSGSYSALDVSVLQEYIMPNTIPQIECTGGKTVMVFQSNAAGRKTADSSCLMYSVLEDGEWSEPQAVYDNGSCDLYSSMKVINDTLYLVWQKAGEQVTDSEDALEVLDDMEEKSEICFARFDPQNNSFEAASYVTDDNVTDMMPVFVENTEDVRIVWIRNTDNDFFNTSGTNCVMTSKLENGAWTSPEQVTTTSEYTGELAAAMADGKLAVSYVTTDVESTTEGEVHPKVMLAVDGTVSMVSEDGIPAQSICFHKGQLYYLQDSLLHKVDVTNGSDETLLMESNQGQTDLEDGESEEELSVGCFGSAYRIYENGEKTAIIWTEATEEGGRILSSVKGEGGYCQPVTLYESEKNIQNFDAVLLEDGNWQFVCNEKDTVDGEDRVSLLFAQKESMPKLALEYITAEEAEITDGLMPVQIAVTNEGETEVTSYTVQIRLAEGNVIEKEIVCSLQPGQGTVLTESIDVSELTDTASLSVSVLAQGQRETEGTSQILEVGNTDVSLHLGKQTSGDLEKVTFTATVTNESYMDTEATVKWYEKETGRLLKIEPAGEISAGERKEVSMQLSAEEVSIGSADARYYYATVTTDKTDYNETNNTDHVVVYPEEIKSTSTSSGGNTAQDSSVVQPSQTPSGTLPPQTKKDTKRSSSDRHTFVVKAPGKVNLKKVKALGRQKVRVTWKWLGSQNGYQLQYARNRSFTKKKKTQNKKFYTSTATLKKLQKGKTYYFRVRAYRKTLYGGKKYGKWSNVKKVKVR